MDPIAKANERRRAEATIPNHEFYRHDLVDFRYYCALCDTRLVLGNGIDGAQHYYCECPERNKWRYDCNYTTIYDQFVRL